MTNEFTTELEISSLIAKEAAVIIYFIAITARHALA